MRFKVVKGVFYAVFPVLFNVLFFVLGGTDHPASVWLSYAWIHAAYLILVAASLFAGRAKHAQVYHFTAGQIAFAYFCMELVVGIVFFCLGMARVQTALIVQLVLFCLFLLVFSWNAWHDLHTAANEGRRAEEADFIRTASLEVRRMMEDTSDETLRRSLEKVYDLIRSSPSRSPSSAKASERDVNGMLAQLRSAVENADRERAGELIDTICRTMRERNGMAAVANDKI